MWLFETSNSLNQRLLKTGKIFHCLHTDLDESFGVWLPQEQRVRRVTSIGLCLCNQCITAPSNTFVSTSFQHHVSHPAHLYPEAKLWNDYKETLLQQYWHTFHRIMSSNTQFHRHSSLFAFTVYVCSLTSIPGLNSTFCYWKHNSAICESNNNVVFTYGVITATFSHLLPPLSSFHSSWSIRNLLLRNTKLHYHIGEQHTSGGIKTCRQTPFRSLGQDSPWLTTLSSFLLRTPWENRVIAGIKEVPA